MQNYKIPLERKLPICYNYHVVVGSFLSTGKEYEMGKSLKGKECGKGIYQRKDGLYHARFVDKAGIRQEKYFRTVIGKMQLSDVKPMHCKKVFLSTGARESRQKTAPRIPTFISAVMRQESNTSVCTLYAILTPREQSKAVCSPRSFKSCLVTQV